MAKKIVAVTACTTGIAHTYMAAEKLEQVGTQLGYDIKVETQGASGQENPLADSDIKDADAIILAVDKNIDMSRFAGKDVLIVAASKAIKNPESLFEQALNKVGTTRIKSSEESSDELINVGSFSGVYKHIMSGVSYMIPVVVAGGILLALSFAFGIYAAEEVNSLPWVLNQIGSSALGLMVPVLSAFIGHSIANKQGFAPAIVGGIIANSIGAGFLGGILSGLIAGYLVVLLNKGIKVPKSLAGLKTILIIPVLSTLIVGLLLYYVIGTPIQLLMAAVTNFLSSMSGAGVIILGLFFGLLYFDLGGPCSKVIYTFGVGALSEQLYGPMAAAMVCGMVPPIGIAISTFVQKNLWTKAERETGKAALVLGLSFITEGAIPFAASDPITVLPACMIGSAVGSIVSFLLNVEIRAPHGGFFLTLIPNAISNLFGFFIALLAGSIATAVVLGVLKTIKMKKKSA